MANTENADQTGTVYAEPSTTTETSTEKTDAVSSEQAAGSTESSDVTPVAPAGVDEDQFKAAREQFEKDQEARRENPDVVYVREANPELGGESF